MSTIAVSPQTYAFKPISVQGRYNLNNAGGGSSIPSGNRVGGGGLGARGGSGGSINRGGSNIPSGNRVGGGGLGARGGSSGSINRGGSSIPYGVRVGSGGLGSISGSSGSINRGSSSIPSGRRVGSGGLGSISGSSGSINRGSGGGLGSGGLSSGGLRTGGGSSGGGIGGGGLSSGSGGGLGGGGSPVGSGGGNQQSTGPGDVTVIYIEHRKPISASVSVLVEQSYDPVTGLLIPEEVVRVLRVVVGGIDSTPGRSDQSTEKAWENLVMGDNDGLAEKTDDSATETIDAPDPPPMSELVARDGSGLGTIISKEWRELVISNGDNSKSTTRIDLSAASGTTVLVEALEFHP